METIINDNISIASELLKKGEVLAIPTETVYGLAGDFSDKTAINQIFKVKNRPSHDPLILHISNFEMLDRIAETNNALAMKIAYEVWPGPLTILFRKKSTVSDSITSGLQTVAVRMPSHPLFLKLIEHYGIPLAAPSANPFGYISPTSPEHVFRQLGGKIPMILDGGECTVGIESTIISIENDEIEILRFGGYDIEMLTKYSNNIRINKTSGSNPKAPGMLDKHYSPKKSLYYFDSEKLNEKDGLIRFNSFHTGLEKANQIVLSPESDLRIAARNLYSALRQMDESHFERIFIEKIPDKGIGMAINDRIARAVRQD